MLRAEQVSLAYAAGAPVLDRVSLELVRGELLAVCGPNGAGKTSLLRVLSGVLPPQAGTVYLGPAPLASLSRRDIARRVGVVEQDMAPSFDYTVAEIVSLGRLPHRSRLQALAAADLAIVEESLAATGLLDLRDRHVRSLSSGERQRAYIALCLCQRPQVLLLDEPLAHLDIRYQAEVLQLLRRLAHGGLAVLLTLHDLNLLSFVDRVALLSRGRVLASGPPQDVLSEALLAEAFGTPLRVLEVPGWPGRLVLPGAPRS